ncbi:serine/threonine-protein kinase RIO3 [Folsomia candida]|nr:serine/threonine-protein kinase RIO3 [Folsomia candida]
MSTEMMAKDDQFIIIPKRAWKVPTWKPEPSPTVRKEKEPSFVDIMNEQLQERVEEEEFENYVRQEYVTMSNDFVNLKSDQEYSIMLKSCLDQELNLHVLELDDEEEDDSEEEVDYQDDSALIESTYFSKINEHFTKHSHSSTKCQETKQKQRVRGRTKSQSQSDIDSDTRITLYKFMKKSVLNGTHYGIVNKGKKSLILHANGGIKKSEKGESVHLPKECAIKVFKPLPISHADDESRPASAAVWAHREFQNLKRLERAGIPSPKAAFVKKAVLVMEFLGKDGKSAWKLRDYPFTNEATIKLAYEQVIRNMKIMYKSCHLIHSDLTEKSILFYNNQCYFTDLAHALEATERSGNADRYADAFLYRNCRNIVDFFQKRGLQGIFTQDALFKEVTGFEYPGVAMDAEGAMQK